MGLNCMSIGFPIKNSDNKVTNPKSTLERPTMWKSTLPIQLVIFVCLLLASKCSSKVMTPPSKNTIAVPTVVEPTVMCLDDKDDFNGTGWKSLYTNYSYAETSSELPSHLRNKLDDGASGMFYFEGGQNPNQWFISSHFKSQLGGGSEVCMYIKYYGDTGRNVRILVFPGIGESGEGDYFTRLTPTLQDYQWGEQVVRINRNKLRGTYASIGVKTLGLRAGEYFLVDKIIIKEGGSCDSIKEFSKLCPAPIIPITQRKNHRRNSIQTTISGFPNDTAECIDLIDQYDKSDWNFSSTILKYAPTSNDLPLPLRGKLEGQGIFYTEIQGDNDRPHLQYTDFSGKLPIFLYLKYYIHNQDPNGTRQKQVAVTPTMVNWTIPVGLEETKDFQWSEFWIEIDGVKGVDLGIDIAVLQFLPGDYFLIDQLILTQGYPITQKQQFYDLCDLDPGQSTTTAETTEQTTSESTTDSSTSTEMSSEETEETGPGIHLWTVILIGVLIFAFTSFCVVFLWRRAKFRRQRLSNSEVSAFKFGCRFSSHPQDPHTSIYSRAYDRGLEIPRDKIELDDTLDSGQFGIVKKGYLIDDDGNRELVAVKMVKPDVDAATFKSTLLSEIKIMSYLGRHKNIARLIGACTTGIKDLEVFAVVEYCANGDLRNFLRQDGVLKFAGSGNGYIQLSEPSVFIVPQLLKLCRDIANGMRYLTEKKVVHGDLATRNILLTDKMKVKISDFGLSRQLLTYSVYFKKQQVALPWCWMPPEALKYREFSVKSDVWSFGVVMWEIFSMGAEPYAGSSFGSAFVKELIEGRRLDKPEWATDFIYGLMMNCWQKERKTRPSFQRLYGQLNKILKDFSHNGSGGQDNNERINSVSGDVVITIDNIVGHHDEREELLRTSEASV